MCKHRISIFFAEILHGTLEYESTQTVKVPEGSESEGGKWIALTYIVCKFFEIFDLSIDM